MRTQSSHIYFRPWILQERDFHYRHSRSQFAVTIFSNRWSSAWQINCTFPEIIPEMRSNTPAPVDTRPPARNYENPLFPVLTWLARRWNLPADWKCTYFFYSNSKRFNYALNTINCHKHSSNTRFSPVLQHRRQTAHWNDTRSTNKCANDDTGQSSVATCCRNFGWLSEYQWRSTIQQLQE